MDDDAERPKTWYKPLVDAARFGLFMLAHTINAIVLITLLTVVSRWIAYIGDPLLFGRVSVSYVFDAMDLAILLVFLLSAVTEAVLVFKGGR